MPVLAYLDLSTGISGDMLLAALIDLGVDEQAWAAEMRRVLPDLEVEFPETRTGAFRARSMILRRPERLAFSTHREFAARIDSAGLDPAVRDRALRALLRLAEAEARLHGCSVDAVHFHEIAGPDTLVDVVGAALAWENLGITEAYCSPFPLGAGEIQSRHGPLPLPAPAALELMRGFPTSPSPVPGETCTPTGTALATAWCRPGSWTAGTVVRGIGYGAGSRKIPGRANLLRVWLGEAPEGDASGGEDAEQAWQIECNLDNMTGEHLAFAAEKLFAAGCADVWQEPITMKKGRLGVKLCALATDGTLAAALAVYAAETYTGGMRWHPVRRRIGAKTGGEVTTSAGAVVWKGNRFSFPSLQRRIPEFESVKAAALQSGRPFAELYEEAAHALKHQHSVPGAVEASGEAGHQSPEEPQ